MYIIAIGTGGIKPNVSTLGADQFDIRYKQDRKEKQSYFNYFYWSINLGALLSYTIIAYICQYGISFLGGQNYGFLIGYSIPTIMMFIAIIVFISGSSRYKIVKVNNNMINLMINIMYYACISYMKACYKYICSHVYSLYTTYILSRPQHHQQQRYEQPTDTTTSSTTNTTTTNNTNNNNIHIQSTYNFTTTTPTTLHSEERGHNSDLPPIPAHFLDRAKLVYGGKYTNKQVNIIKLIINILPILLSLIPYWAVYSQMNTIYQNQGCQMYMYIDIYVYTIQIPVSTLNIFDTLSILVLLPIFDLYIYPYYNSILLYYNLPSLTMLYKIGCGYVCILLAMLVAAYIEYIRIYYAPTEKYYTDIYSPTATSNTTSTGVDRVDISPCINLNDYNPYLYLQYINGISTYKPTYCHLIPNCTPSNTTSTTTLSSTNQHPMTSSSPESLIYSSSSLSSYYNTTASFSPSSYHSSINQHNQPLSYTYNTNNILYNSSNNCSDITCIQCSYIPQMSRLSILYQIPQYTLIGMYSNICIYCTNIHNIYCHIHIHIHRYTYYYILLVHT